MSAQQHQHYLPQSYQRGWAAADGRPYVYERRHDKLVCARKATKSTGAAPGLYFIPMAPPERQNVMEDEFWRIVDQWGADGLALLKSPDPAAAARLDREKLAVFVMSFLFRNPRAIAKIEDEAKRHVMNGCLKDDYARHRRPHEPPTFEAFVQGLEAPGLSEYGAECLKAQVLNKAIREQLLTMRWEVVTMANSEPILTSDVPLITFKGLKDDDGCLMLPLSSTEFFIAYNNGRIDMRREVDQSIQAGAFIPAMNQHVVQNKIEFVYAADDSQKAFVARHWAIEP